MSTTTRKLQLVFLDDSGEEFSFSLPQASEDLKGDDGPDTVNDLATQITTDQPFEVQIASLSEAKLVETTTTAINISAE